MNCNNNRRPVSLPLIVTVVLLIFGIASVIITTVSRRHQPAPKSSAASRNLTDATPQDVHVVAMPNAIGTAAELTPLGDAIDDYLGKNDPGSSVYLETLNSHLSVNVGKTSDYSIKSLMKVPLVMGLYKAHELKLLNMDDMVTITPSEIDKSFGTLWQKKAGYQLSLRTAAGYALRSSDNTAIKVINDHVFKVLPKEKRAYNTIGMQYRVDDNGDTYTSTAAYSTVFRCLYESCYNSRADSQEMLSLMKQSDFTAARSQLPSDVPLAHKIGSVGIDGYNDCGIVFAPKAPFMFCIMLTQTEPQADTDISWIVKRAYDYLEKGQ